MAPGAPPSSSFLPFEIPLADRTVAAPDLDVGERLDVVNAFLHIKITLVNAFLHIKIMDMKLMLILMQMPQRLYLMLHAMLILLCRIRATNLLTWS